jgi:hypothetical protein
MEITPQCAETAVHTGLQTCNYRKYRYERKRKTANRVNPPHNPN